MNVFVRATREKFRFPFKGMISVEDLWDLNVKELDSIYKVLNAEAKIGEVESLLVTKSTEDTVLDSKIEIIKFIVQTKQDEVEARQAAKEKAAKKHRLQELIANKQDEALQNLSVEDLQKMLADLN